MADGIIDDVKAQDSLGMAETDADAAIVHPDPLIHETPERIRPFNMDMDVIEYIAGMTEEFASIARKRHFAMLAYFLDLARLQASEDIEKIRSKV